MRYWIRTEDGCPLNDDGQHRYERIPPGRYLETNEATYESEKTLRERLARNIIALKDKHKGQTIHVLGNGPSLKAFRRTDNDIVIGVNAAYEHCRLDYWLCMDSPHKDMSRVLNKHMSEWLITNMISPVPNPPILVTHENLLACRHLIGHMNGWKPFCTFVRSKEPERNPKTGLFWHGSSCHAATDLARHMGASTIVLWGVDYNDRSHFYSNMECLQGDSKDNPGWQWVDKEKHFEAWDLLAKSMRNYHVQCFNANKDSALKTFPWWGETVQGKAFFEDMELRATPILHVYATAGTGYEPRMYRCLHDFEKWGVRPVPTVYDNGRDWMRNCLARPQMLLRTCESSNPRIVGLMDCDLEPLQDPRPWLEVPEGFDMAVTIRPAAQEHNKYSAGLVLFDWQSPLGRATLMDWAKRCAVDNKPRRKLREQLYLHEAIECMEPRVHDLGEKMNRLPEKVVQGDDTIIRHDPASREMLSSIGGER